MFSKTKIEQLQSLDLIQTFDHWKNCVIIPHQTRGLLVVPLAFIEGNTSEDFVETHKKIAGSTVDSLQYVHWIYLGYIERRWVSVLKHNDSVVKETTTLLRTIT